MSAQLRLFRIPSAPEKDICARRHRGAPTSVEANRATEPRKDQARQRVVAFIRNRGREGAIVEEIASRLNTPYTSVSARCSELKRSGEIVTTDEKRLTSSGCRASVLVAREFVWPT